MNRSLPEPPRFYRSFFVSKVMQPYHLQFGFGSIGFPFCLGFDNGLHCAAVFHCTSSPNSMFPIQSVRLISKGQDMGQDMGQDDE